MLECPTPVILDSSPENYWNDGDYPVILECLNYVILEVSDRGSILYSVDSGEYAPAFSNKSHPCDVSQKDYWNDGDYYVILDSSPGNYWNDGDYPVTLECLNYVILECL
jgi:hypothetical protein